MDFELRPYQREAADAVMREWGKVRSTLMVQATGCGKTITMASIARRCTDNGGRVLLLAHRGELLDQAADKFERAVGISCAREQGESRADESPHKVVVGSVQTLMNDRRLSRYAPDSFTHVFVDEAHHAAAKSYKKILGHFATSKVLGVTATPDRGDKRALNETFETIAYEYDLRQAVEDGYLCSIEVEQVPVKIDLRNVKVSRITKDYDERELARAMDPHLEAIADEVSKMCANRKTVVFLPLVDIAQDFADMLNARGMRCAEVDGNSTDRAEVLDGFRRNEYNAITNAMLLTEGWDCPDVDCVVVLRPTKSRALYCQMVGRGTRLSPETGKEKLLLPDFLWMSDEHDLCKPASLLGASAEVESRVSAMGDVDDIFDAEKQALHDIEEERKQVIANVVDANSDRSRRRFNPLGGYQQQNVDNVDPFEYALSIGNVSIADYEPTFRWETDRPSEQQLKTLDGRGYDLSRVTTKGLASKIYELPTPRQTKLLERKGFKHIGTWWDINSAKAMCGRIAQNGWRVPDGIDPETYDPRDAPDDRDETGYPMPWEMQTTKVGWYGWND